MGGSRLPPPVLISFTDATTGARKVSMRSNHSRRQRIVNFTGSLDSPLEGAGFEPSVPLIRPVPEWLKKVPELCAHGQPRCVRRAARCRPISEALGERFLRAGTTGSGQAAKALADFLRGVEMLAASEALRIGQRFSLEAGTLLEIGERLNAVGPIVGGLLRQQVLTRQLNRGLVTSAIS